jgi:hypothetical protein
VEAVEATLPFSFGNISNLNVEPALITQLSTVNNLPSFGNKQADLCVCVCVCVWGLSDLIRNLREPSGQERNYLSAKI